MQKRFQGALLSSRKGLCFWLVKLQQTVEMRAFLRRTLVYHRFPYQKLLLFSFTLSIKTALKEENIEYKRSITRWLKNALLELSGVRLRSTFQHAVYVSYIGEVRVIDRQRAWRTSTVTVHQLAAKSRYDDRESELTGIRGSWFRCVCCFVRTKLWCCLDYRIIDILLVHLGSVS